MKKSLQFWSIFLLFLFLFPILLNFLPTPSSSTTTVQLNDQSLLVFASNITELDVPKSDKKALLYSTHNHEAFKPIIQDKEGKVTVSHQSENIMKFTNQLQSKLEMNGMVTEVLPIDNMMELNRQKKNYNQAYESIRPFVKEAVQAKDYSVIIDLHRDSVSADKTTLQHNGTNYAKVAFVIGVEHQNYAKNKALAAAIKDEMEKIVPGITRTIISKGGAGVNGKYNQDLHPGLILMELGGVGNKEDELNRTTDVIAQAVTTIFSSTSSEEN